jgi:hypothetical protein
MRRRLLRGDDRAEDADSNRDDSNTYTHLKPPGQTGLRESYQLAAFRG